MVDEVVEWSEEEYSERMCERCGAMVYGNSGVEWSEVEWSEVEWSGVKWSGVEWSGVEFSVVE